jgi:hypothetical protein
MKQTTTGASAPGMNATTFPTVDVFEHTMPFTDTPVADARPASRIALAPTADQSTVSPLQILHRKLLGARKRLDAPDCCFFVTVPPCVPVAIGDVFILEYPRGKNDLLSDPYTAIYLATAKGGEA